MRGDRRLPAASAAVLLALALLACAPGPAPVRLGVLADCVGFARGSQEVVLAGAELPLLQRGAQRRGARPTDGVTAATVAGRPVELVTACTEGGEYSTLIEQARRLVEVERADVVVGGTWPGDGLVLRELARRYPSTAFVVALPGPREVTLDGPPANVFRFAADHSQQAAGLGTYAFRDLGWREALVLVEDTEPGWGGAAAFVAEFCALGGQVRQELVPLLDRERYTPPPRPAAGGVVVIANPLGLPPEWLTALAGPAPATSLLLGPAFAEEPGTLAALPASLRGVVTVAAARDPAVVHRYVTDHLRSFPDSGEAQALQPYPVAYHDAVEAILTAVGSGAPLLAALGRVRADLVTGPVHLDADRAAVVSTALVRAQSAEPVRVVRDVDQTVGGLLQEPYQPFSGEQPCHAAAAPPWAR
jgi:branched-chain amino acid transport system substrate-binding protein